MDDRILQFRVGVVMLAALMIAGILLFLLGEFPTLVTDRNTLYVVFDQAPGVTVDTPVRTSGILIGRVSDVALQEDRDVLVTLKIDRKYMPRSNEVCRIASGSILGDALLEFVPGERPTQEVTVLQDKAVIEGLVANNPLDTLRNLEGQMATALTTMDSAGREVGALAHNANEALLNNRDRFERIMQKSELALDRFDTAMLAVNDLVADPELNRRLHEALQGLPETLNESRDLIERMKGVVERADVNLENLEGFTEPLGARGEQLIANLETSTENLSDMIEQLARLARAANNPDGTLGQLMTNPELYQRLNAAADNVQEVSGKLRPIINDVRVFTDKIARDPRILGVKGALNRNQSGIK
ncbi:MlaD family protein [Blastopirellula retiformator]|nr:MlaD family protein [Blastopirellula retiformator]